MQFAGLERSGRIVIFANFNRIEIWEPMRFEAANPTTDAAEHDQLAALYFNNVRTPGTRE
jgi:DNA-binding transcriptional regulator/RsmH inhibitor MraZ